ncbi:hypothetical protein NNJEOMEG_02780 [Fundidesulfovibrio magnetotacticus]|uniref:PglD N-terminal domain-containing protein n=1 Tax=Fundidesulfovibrio magnetotacticus TaxID=2730080 RepID=A0A6V8LR10_9BACT|nr:hypothetical protein [Fundidesulfovibrio magnetotacticus]GFK94932.1 hypothetical protein NNJEOMEG_02780 [Fundidesulfovibrio magnetotacticus]
MAVHPVEASHVRGLLGGATRLALYGAGGKGRTLPRFLRETVPECEVAGFLDSDPALRGRRVDGLPVAGPEALEAWGIQAVAVSTYAKHAVASALRQFRRESGGSFAVLTGLDELHSAHCFAALRELL